jgi:hypothetical protein
MYPRLVHLPHEVALAGDWDLTLVPHNTILGRMTMDGHILTLHFACEESSVLPLRPYLD